MANYCNHSAKVEGKTVTVTCRYGFPDQGVTIFSKTADEVVAELLAQHPGEDPNADWLSYVEGEEESSFACDISAGRDFWGEGVTEDQKALVRKAFAKLKEEGIFDEQNMCHCYDNVE
jgi:hypothetical protein